MPRRAPPLGFFMRSPSIIYVRCSHASQSHVAFTLPLCCERFGNTLPTSCYIAPWGTRAAWARRLNIPLIGSRRLAGNRQPERGPFHTPARAIYQYIAFVRFFPIDSCVNYDGGRA